MDIHESVHRILLQADSLADLFYLVFLKDYPEMQGFFGGVDMKRQNVLLTMALLTIERHYHHRYEMTSEYLKLLGERHRRRGIGADLYPKWQTAMLATLERFHGSDWNDSLAEQWREAIDVAIEIMAREYE